MKRINLLEKLKNYHPLFPEEIAAKQHMIEFINAQPGCFERSLAIGHITASAWLLNQDTSKVLLMHHAKLNLWLQLGGHCDGDPDVVQVALKEAQEESGITDIIPVHEDIFDIDIHRVPANTREQEHYHYDVRFLLRTTTDAQIVQNNESKALVWFDQDLHKLPTQSRSIVRMFRKWVQIG